MTSTANFIGLLNKICTHLGTLGTRVTASRDLVVEVAGVRMVMVMTYTSMTNIYVAPSPYCNTVIAKFILGEDFCKYFSLFYCFLG